MPSGAVNDWVERAIARHVESVARGEHDGECEWRADRFLCHCAKRERIARGVTELPQILFEYPICDGCDQHVEHDGDTFYCPRCHCAWGSNPVDGTRAEHWTDDYGDLT